MNSFVKHGLIDENDVVIMKLHRHPMGLFMLYVANLLGLFAGVGLVVWASNQSLDLTSSQKSLALLGVVIVTAVMLLVLYVATVVYWASALVLTETEVKQNIQNGLFSKKTSRLGLTNVEDVSMEQNGILASMFNYGTLNIETAGEQANFKFTFCPNPGECTKVIMNTREKLMGSGPSNNSATTQSPPSPTTV